jgi:hypothetical protein
VKVLELGLVHLKLHHESLRFLEHSCVLAHDRDCLLLFAAPRCAL